MKSPIILLLVLGLLTLGCCGITPSSESTYYRPSGQSGGVLAAYPNLDAEISGCNTNFGVSGETTTVYVTISNTGSGRAENVVVQYAANDIETKPVSQTIGTIPAGKRITVSSYINTKFGVPTNAEVHVNAKDTDSIVRYSADCRKLDQQTLDNLDYLVKSGLLTG